MLVDSFMLRLETRDVKTTRRCRQSVSGTNQTRNLLRVKILIAVAVAARMSFSFLHGKLEKLNQRNASAAINDGPGQQVNRRGTEEKGRKSEIVETNQKRCNQAKGCYSSRHTHKVRRLSLSFSLPMWMSKSDVGRISSN